MIGAIAGDIIGSIYEGAAAPPADFPLFTAASRFTDDTVLTVAVASALRNGSDYARAMRAWGNRYPHAGYGGMFLRWLRADDPKPYGSWGNGSAMRVAPVGWAFDDLATVRAEARRSAEVTHDHPEGIRGAEAIAGAVFLARTTGATRPVLDFLEGLGYDCSVPLDVIRARGGFDVSCEGTVPAAAAAFRDGEGFESTVRNAVSLGGDTDTLACIAGALAEAREGRVPAAIQSEVWRRLDDALRAEVAACAARFDLPLTAIR